MQARNDSVVPEATGVIAPLVRAATHVGWCIAYNAAITEETLNDNDKRVILLDLDDAERHLASPNTSDLVTAFVGPDAAQTLALLRSEFTETLPDSKVDMGEHLQTLADNIAQNAAELERAMAGNNDAQAGTNT